MSTTMLRSAISIAIRCVHRQLEKHTGGNLFVCCLFVVLFVYCFVVFFCSFFGIWHFWMQALKTNCLLFCLFVQLLASM